jgi:hypothetical protein
MASPLSITRDLCFRQPCPSSFAADQFTLRAIFDNAPILTYIKVVDHPDCAQPWTDKMAEPLLNPSTNPPRGTSEKYILPIVIHGHAKRYQGNMIPTPHYGPPGSREMALDKHFSVCGQEILFVRVKSAR